MGKIMNRCVLISLVGASFVALSSAAYADEPPAPTGAPAAATAPPAPPAAPAPAPVVAPTASAGGPNAPGVASAGFGGPVASPDDAAADLARLRALAERGQDPVRSYRLGGGLTGLGLGAVAIPVGAVMMGRDSGSIGGGVVLGAGIGSVVGGALVLTGLFDDSPYSAVTAAIAREKAQGKDDRSALRAGEAELKKSVESIRSGRTIGGALIIGLGVASLGAGAVFGLGDFTGPKLERREQDAIAAGFFGYGILTTLVGIQTLLFPTPVESAWDGYSAAKRTAQVGPRLVGVGGGPLPGGGASVGLTGLF